MTRQVNCVSLKIFFHPVFAKRFTDQKPFRSFLSSNRTHIHVIIRISHHRRCQPLHHFHCPGRGPCTAWCRHVAGRTYDSAVVICRAQIDIGARRALSLPRYLGCIRQFGGNAIGVGPSPPSPPSLPLPLPLSPPPHIRTDVQALGTTLVGSEMMSFVYIHIYIILCYGKSKSPLKNFSAATMCFSLRLPAFNWSPPKFILRSCDTLCCIQ